jgi:hypothetical protein
LMGVDDTKVQSPAQINKNLVREWG